MELDVLLADAVGRRASDIHFVAGEPPIFRINRELERHTSLPAMGDGDLRALLLPALPESARIGLENGTQSHAKTVLRIAAAPGYRFQLTVYRSEGGLGATVNLFFGEVPALSVIAGDALGVLESVAALKRGLVLFTGPTGSGKNTTSASVVETINQSRSERIFVVDDTSGYIWKSQKSIVTTLVIGQDYETYEDAAETIFGGADADVVLFADLPSLEAARLALVLADTGHLVIATIGAESAPDAVVKLAGFLPGPREHACDLLARTLVAAFNQRLLVRSNGRGRVPAYETLFATPEIRDIIRAGSAPEALYAAMQRSDDPNTRTLSTVIDGLQASGQITEEMASQHRPATH